MLLLFLLFELCLSLSCNPIFLRLVTQKVKRKSLVNEVLWCFQDLYDFCLDSHCIEVVFIVPSILKLLDHFLADLVENKDRVLPKKVQSWKSEEHV